MSNPLSNNLREGLRELQRFRQTFGHSAVPPNWKPNRKLAQWVATVRARLGDLSVDQLEALDRAHFDFGADRYWISRFFELTRFKQRFGHCIVQARDPRNPQLGAWLSGQRARQDRMPVQRRRLLDKLGMDWDPAETLWNGNYEKLLAFKAKYGHCRVPKSHSYHSLSIWVSNVRKRTHALTPRKKLLLNRAGFVWNVREAEWKKRLAELKAYHKRHGHCRITNKGYRELGVWASELRAAKPRLSRARVTALGRLGFEWTPHKTEWKNRFAELKAFKKKFGHCLVPMENYSNMRLAHWVGTQRLNRNRLSRERRQRLEKLGFTWKVIEMSPRKDWDARFRELVEFKRRFGHCSVPANRPENVPLANWVSRQKRDRAELSPQQKRRLEALGLSWHWRDADWERMFAQLAAFKKKHGHADVPYKSSDRDLRSWVLRQRYRKTTLSPDRTRRLNSLGLTWRPKHPKG